MRYKKLGDIATYVNGYAFKPADRGKEGLPIIRIQDLTGNAYDLGFYNGDYPDKIEINNGDVLISWSASLGVYVWKNGKALLNQHIFKVIFDKVDIDKNYFVYAVSYKLREMASKTHGATMKHIVKKDFDNTLIPFPEFEKQLEIAKILCCAKAINEAKKLELQKLDELIKSRFIELFGDLESPDCKWDREKMVDVCANPDDIKCGPFGTQLNKDEYVNTGVAVWEIPQINSFFSTIPTHYLTEEKAKQLEAYSIKPDDIAMSRKGNVGKCAVFPSTFEPGVIHSDVIRIRVDSNRVLPLFVMHQLHYSGAVQHQIELVSSGAIMAGINVTKLKHIFVHIPPMELQQQFVTFVKHTDKLKAELQKSIDKTQMLFDSLMQQYFG